MNTKGIEIIGSCKAEMLIADASVKTDVVIVTLAKTEEAKSLKRGCVLAANDADGKCRLISGAEGETAAYILAEDVDTSSAEEVAAEAYQTGKFIRNALTVEKNYILSVSDERALRDAGIYLENAMA